MTRLDTDNLDRADFADCFTDQPAPVPPEADLDRAQRALRARHQRILAGAILTSAIVATLLLAGPWPHGRPQLASPAAPTGQVSPSWSGCAVAGAFDQSWVVGPPPQTRPVPADFQAVEVRRCTQDNRRADNGDEVLVHVEQAAPATPALLAYLALPSLDPPAVKVGGRDRHICPASYVPAPLARAAGPGRPFRRPSHPH